MSDDAPRVLVSVAVLEGESIPEPVADLLSTLPVVLLGYHVLPEQTPPGQARMQFEERAQSALDDVAEAFGGDRTDLETRLVFTHDEAATIERVATETDAGAVLVSNPSGRVRKLLVAVGPEVETDRLSGFVKALVADRDVAVSLLDVGGDSGTSGSRVEDAASRLRDAGIRTTVLDPGEFEGGPVESVAAAASGHDAVVMGERDETLRSLVFGDPAEQVAERSLGPVLVVRRPRETPE